MTSPRINTYRAMLADTIEALAQIESDLMPQDDRARILQTRITHMQERLDQGGSENEFYETLLYALGDMKRVQDMLLPLSITRTTLEIQMAAVEGVLTAPSPRAE